jgi:hypothetical protein
VFDGAGHTFHDLFELVLDAYPVNIFLDHEMNIFNLTESEMNQSAVNNVIQNMLGNISGVFGCTDPEACNYDELATTDDGSCEYEQLQCRDLDGDGWGTSEFTFTTCDIEDDIWVTNCDDIDDTIYCESNEVDCAGILCGDGIEDECGECGGNGMEDFYADWDGDGLGDCTGDVYTVCPNEAESWMSSECDSHHS